MKSFKEFVYETTKKKQDKSDDDLDEQAIAFDGHYNFVDNDLNKNFNEISRKESKELYKDSEITIIYAKVERQHMIFGVDNDNLIVSQMYISPFTSIRKIREISTGKCYQVKGVMVLARVRRRNIAFKMYNALLTNGYTIIGDKEQYFGARRLWEKLSKSNEYIVSIFCYYPREIIYYNVELEGDDTRLWIHEKDNSKENKLVKESYYSIVTLKN